MCREIIVNLRQQTAEATAYYGGVLHTNHELKVKRGRRD